MGASSGAGGMGGGQQGQSAPPPRMPSNTVYPTFSTPTGEPGVLSPGAYARAFSQEGQNMGGLPAMDQSIRDYVKENMGDYGSMVNKANELQLSQGDISRASGVPMGGVYTYMNRPGYQTYGPSGQFNQPIYQANYDRYAQPSYFYQPSYNPFSYGGAMGGMGGGLNRAAINSLPMYAMSGAPRFAEGGDVEEDQGIAALRGA